MVIQLAKIDGMKVIASAGSDDKVKECKEAGADIAFNYKNVSTEEVLKKEGPLNVSVILTFRRYLGSLYHLRYWDNVGGPTLDAALGATATHARVIVCGMISEYNNKNGTNLKVCFNFPEAILTHLNVLCRICGRYSVVHSIFTVSWYSTSHLNGKRTSTMLYPRKLSVGS